MKAKTAPHIGVGSAGPFHTGFDQRRIEIARTDLPDNLEGHTDKYFLRTRAVLRGAEINPWMVGQIFARVPNGQKAKLAGVHELLACFLHYGKDFLDAGGRIWTLPEGTEIGNCETMAVIEGPAQAWVHFETMYLGLLSSSTTKWFTGESEVQLGAVESRMRQIVRVLQRRKIDSPCKITYFGARHYHWAADTHILEACWRSNVAYCSTDSAAETARQKGLGTTPHVLFNVLGWKYGRNHAVPIGMRLFNQHIADEVPRVCLVDWGNRELTDAGLVINELGSKLRGFRLDTAGENIAEGAIGSLETPSATDRPIIEAWRRDGLYLMPPAEAQSKYWYGTGVTVSAAVALIQHQRRLGFNGAPPMLTSGFANPIKVEAFVLAEKLLGIDLLSGGIGAGEVYPGIFYKMDAIGFGEDDRNLSVMHKVGRKPNPNWNLLPALGNFSGNPTNPFSRLGCKRK